MSTSCWAVRMRLPSLEAGEELVGRLGRHAATCLRCQAEAARYRSLQRRLAQLAAVDEAAPGTLVDDVLAGIGEPADVVGDRDLPRTAVAAAAAGAVVAAAAAAGAVVVIGLRRSRAA